MNAQKNFFETFDYSKNLIICGPVGVGKTHKALELLKRYRGNPERQKAWTYKISDARFKELIGSRQMIHKPFDVGSSPEYYPLDMLILCDLILFDDIGVTDITEAYLRKLTHILDERSAK